MKTSGAIQAPIVLLLLALLLPSALGRAQERERGRSLTKSELVRLLVDSSLSQAELAEVIRRACLTFRPDEQDLVDLERAGAGDAVLEQVVDCGRRLDLSFASERRTGRAGESVVIQARAERGGQPAEGLGLVLVEGGEAIASARTDGAGRASFRIPVGSSLGGRTLRLRAASEPSGDAAAMTLSVRPGAPAEATLTIPSASTDSSMVPVTARVRDPFGHGVPGVVVYLSDASASPAPDSLRLEGRTGDDGEVRFRVSEDRFVPGARLVLVHGSDTLATARPPPSLARADADGPDRDADPSSVAVRPRARVEGREDSASTEPAAAADPVEETSTIGLAPGWRELERGRSLDAVEWFRQAVELDPRDAEAWAGLARAWLAAGEAGMAREAILEGRRRAEEPAALDEAVDALGGVPPWGRFWVFGGGAWHGGEMRNFGALRLRFRPLPRFVVWAGYESTLVEQVPFLVRGGSDVPAVSGGASFSYGPERSVTTELSAAHLDHGGDLRQLVYRVENEFRLSAGGRPVRWRIGGAVGRWWDRDDWLVSTEVDVPVGDDVALVPSLHAGELSGTAVAERGRLPATEWRGELTVRVEPSRRWSVAPTLAYGRVSPVEPASSTSGDLLEGRVRLSVRLGPSVSLLVRGRHQSPPFADPFSDVAAGLSYDLR